MNSGPFAPLTHPTPPSDRYWMLVMTARISRPDGKAAVGYDGQFVCPSNDYARLYTDREKDNMGPLPRGYEWVEFQA